MNITGTLRSLHGNKVGAAIEELHRSEDDLAGALLSLSDRQKADHEIYYVARDIASWCTCDKPAGAFLRRLFA